MASPVAPMKTHKTEASRASKQSWPLAKPLLALAAASLCAGSEGRRMARSVSRADLVGRLRANKYGKTEQEDCVSSTHSPHCLFVTGPRTPGRAFQACPADTERSHRFPDEAKTRKGGRHIGNQAEGASGTSGAGQSLATLDTQKRSKQYRILSSLLTKRPEWWRRMNSRVKEARTPKEWAVQRNEV